jgi:hypothetical protein
VSVRGQHEKQIQTCATRHLMFFVPGTDTSTWGADLPGSPIIGSPDKTDRVTTFLVTLGKWSDGTSASMDAH